MPKGIIEQMQKKAGIRRKARKAGKGQSVVNHNPTNSFSTIMNNGRVPMKIKGSLNSGTISNSLTGSGTKRRRTKKRKK